MNQIGDGTNDPLKFSKCLVHSIETFGRKIYVCVSRLFKFSNIVLWVDGVVGSLWFDKTQNSDFFLLFAKNTYEIYIV